MYRKNTKRYTNISTATDMYIEDKVLSYLTYLLFIEITAYFQTILKHYFLVRLNQNLIKSVNRLSLTAISFAV